MVILELIKQTYTYIACYMQANSFTFFLPNLKPPITAIPVRFNIMCYLNK